MMAPPPWGPPAIAEQGVEVWLRTPLPACVELGAASALFIHGAVTAPAAVESVELTVAGKAHPVLASRMPSPGLARELGPAAERAIFWGLLPLSEQDFAGGRATVGLRVRQAGDAVAEPSLGSLGLDEPQPPAATPAAGTATIAICMATHEPAPRLLERQLESLRRQTRDDWICLISDDASSASSLAELERLTADDPRFVVSAGSRRLGAYENFQRALAMVPAGIEFVAFSDQDDRWYPHKLEVLIDNLGDAELVFSDMRIVDEQGEPLAETYWTHRHPNHRSFASLLLGNTVTGAASLFPRRLLEDALPLPPRTGNLYHDHWLALVARARGEIAYVDEPLYDYVQHPQAVVGHAAANRGVVGGSLPRRLLALRGRPRGQLRDSWRRIYFGEYCRLRLSARVLSLRFAGRLSADRRRALRLLESRGATTIVWLSLRQLRRLHRDETQGSEAAMLRALAWERLLRLPGADDTADADLAGTIAQPGGGLSAVETAR